MVYIMNSISYLPVLADPDSAVAAAAATATSSSFEAEAYSEDDPVELSFESAILAK